MQLRSSAEYAAAIPDGHPVIALIGELDTHNLVYDRLTNTEKVSPQGKQLVARIGILSRQCDAALFNLFPELGEVDKRFDRLTPTQQEKFLDFAFDLYEKIADRECGL